MSKYPFPGTATVFAPYRIDNNYQTGLCPAVQERLEKALNCSLAPDSPFYRWYDEEYKGLKCSVKKTCNRDIHLDKNNPLEEVAYYWLSVHPGIKKYGMHLWPLK
jgi:hypothetical protein